MALLESWKLFPGFPKYEVSDQGNVRHAGLGRLCKLWIVPGSHSGYAYVMANIMSCGRSKKVMVHLAVLRAFGPPKPTPKHMGVHVDGDVTNNRIGNLVWDTIYGANMRKRARGTTTQGAANQHAKLTEAKVLDIRQRTASGTSQADLAKELHVSKSTINLICLGKTWQHVGGPILGKLPQNAKRRPAKLMPANHSVCHRKFCCPICWAESGHPTQCLTVEADRRFCIAHGGKNECL